LRVLRNLAKRLKKTVVVIDKASVHTSEEFEECLPRWKKKGLIIKYLSNNWLRVLQLALTFCSL
jgi:hypothetical protein